jgi:hypothetical protein
MNIDSRVKLDFIVVFGWMLRDGWLGDVSCCVYDCGEVRVGNTGRCMVHMAVNVNIANHESGGTGRNREAHAPK